MRPFRWLGLGAAAAALAFAALAVIATAYTAMRLLGVGPVGTLVAAGVIEEGETVILADFEDRTGDSTLAASVTQALRIDLAQSPVVELSRAVAIAMAAYHFYVVILGVPSVFYFRGTHL